MEHDRLVKLLSPKDVVCDMFAGVGPFAVPAAKKVRPFVSKQQKDLVPSYF
jgi:tRNA G37 N-methylase Trm5